VNYTQNTQLGQREPLINLKETLKNFPYIEVYRPQLIGH